MLSKNFIKLKWVKNELYCDSEEKAKPQAYWYIWIETDRKLEVILSNLDSVLEPS